LGVTKVGQQTKSIPWQWLEPLAMEGVNLVSLQKDVDERPAFPIDHDHITACHDFADTAALIETLDLVISGDTWVARLAGALGKPVWNFVRFSGYWPWLKANVIGEAPSWEHSIWYPSMTLLRQPQLADWDTPIKQATARLRGMVAKKAA